MGRVRSAVVLNLEGEQGTSVRNRLASRLEKNHGYTTVSGGIVRQLAKALSIQPSRLYQEKEIVTVSKRLSNVDAIIYGSIVKDRREFRVTIVMRAGGTGKKLSHSIYSTAASKIPDALIAEIAAKLSTDLGGSWIEDSPSSASGIIRVPRPANQPLVTTPPPNGKTAQNAPSTTDNTAASTTASTERRPTALPATRSPFIVLAGGGVSTGRRDTLSVNNAPIPATFGSIPMLALSAALAPWRGNPPGGALRSLSASADFQASRFTILDANTPLATTTTTFFAALSYRFERLLGPISISPLVGFTYRGFTIDANNDLSSYALRAPTVGLLFETTLYDWRLSAAAKTFVGGKLSETTFNRNNLATTGLSGVFSLSLPVSDQLEIGGLVDLSTHRATYNNNFLVEQNASFLGTLSWNL